MRVFSWFSWHEWHWWVVVRLFICVYVFVWFVCVVTAGFVVKAAQRLNNSILGILWL